MYEYSIGSLTHRIKRNVYSERIFRFLIRSINNAVIPEGIAENFPQNIPTRELMIQQDLAMLKTAKSLREKLCFIVMTIPHAYKIRGYVKK